MENINEKILELFKTMINDIMEVYPEEKGNIYEKYESVLKSMVPTIIDNIIDIEGGKLNINKKLPKNCLWCC